MNATKIVREKKKMQINYVNVKVCDELYELIAREADNTGLNLIDVVVQAVAEHFKRPDLGVVPRKTLGRPRQKALASAV